MAEITADGDIIIGRRRPKNNPLIHRSEVGKPSFHNDLPPLPEGYTFGAPLKWDMEGAGDVMLSWHSHNPPPEKLRYDFGRDFVKLNKNSVLYKCTTPKDVTGFRSGHDIRVKPKVHKHRPTIAPAAVLNNPHHSYGAKSPQSERVADLIQNRWEFEWVTEQRERCESLADAKKREKDRRSSPSRQTLPAKSREKETPAPHPREYFVMKRFRNVPSRFAPSPSEGGARAHSSMY